MILCRVEGSVVATQKNQHLEHNRLLVVQPVDVDGKPQGSSMIALDAVDAGEGDLVLMIREGGCARMIFNDQDIPLQAVVVAVVDQLQVDPLDSWPKATVDGGNKK